MPKGWRFSSTHQQKTSLFLSEPIQINYFHRVCSKFGALDLMTKGASMRSFQSTSQDSTSILVSHWNFRIETIIVSVTSLWPLKKGRERGGKEEKKKRVINHTLKSLYEAKMTAKKSTKTGKNFREGGEIFFLLARIYTPVAVLVKSMFSSFLFSFFFFSFFSWSLSWSLDLSGVSEWVNG